MLLGYLLDMSRPNENASLVFKLAFSLKSFLLSSRACRARFHNPREFCPYHLGVFGARK